MLAKSNGPTGVYQRASAGFMALESINGPLQDLWLTRAGGIRPAGTPQWVGTPNYVQASLHCRLRVKGLKIWLCGYRRPVDPAHVQQRGPTKAKAKTGPGQGADPVVMAQFLGGSDCRNAEKFPLESLFSPEDS